MTPEEFIAKWAASTLTERSAAQQHFIDLCHLLGQPTPAEADPTGTSYTFEKGGATADGGRGFADVWKRNAFGWEYKGPDKDLAAAYYQLKKYADALENPPLLVTSDTKRIEIHTNWTNTVKVVHRLGLQDLADPKKRELLRWVFAEPEKLKPGVTREMVTIQAAERFSEIAHRLQGRGHAPQAVAHFLNRVIFCMFAEDVNLLPNQVFNRLLSASVQHPEAFENYARDLFGNMAKGGTAALEIIPWFNGGLFDDAATLPLEKNDIEVLLQCADLDWTEIEPSIFGTLFERGLDPDKRSQQGAHYTDPDTIMRIVEPVVLAPWERAWESEKAALAAQIEKAKKKVSEAAKQRYRAFLERLTQFRVLDPSCGSGNFLYIALRGLKDFEKRVHLEAEEIGLPREFPRVGPEAVLGLEVNPYAAELARVTVWIGEIQWMLAQGFGFSRNPILRPLDQIACRDALLNDDGSEAAWPKADAIIGNPPFLGDKKLVRGLGQDYVDRLRAAYTDRVPGGADLCCYWFDKMRGEIAGGRVERGGLVATDNIRSSPKNRAVLAAMARDAKIFAAWTDQEWVNEGAAVRVSLICCARHAEPAHRNGTLVEGIEPDLTAGAGSGGAATIVELAENDGIAFSGITKKGSFDIPGALAREMLLAVAGPHGRKNAEVLFPWKNGEALTKGDPDRWIISFGEMSEDEAALFERPFEHVRTHVFPVRATSSSEMEKRRWWLLARRAPDLFAAISGLRRFLVTPEVSKHRVFAWMSGRVVPDKNLVVVAREDDTTFGILQSRIHTLWALRVGTRLENRPRYTSSTTFRTFPFPAGLAPNQPAQAFEVNSHAQAIAAAARRLDELRQGWLVPPDLVDRVPEVVEGYPERILPKTAAAAIELKTRTFTNLYNTNPPWLQHVNRDLDQAVAAAYGWQWPIEDEDVLKSLFTLNRERSEAASRRNST